MPDVIDHDALLSASARAAHAGSAREVAGELLAAANDPGRLVGVSPTLTRVRAADLLSATGDPHLLDEAVAILREAAGLALPGELGTASPGKPSAGWTRRQLRTGSASPTG